MKEEDFFNEDGTLKSPDFSLDSFKNEDGSAKTFVDLVGQIKVADSIQEWVVRTSTLVAMIAAAHYHKVQEFDAQDLLSINNSIAAMMPVELLMLSGASLEYIASEAEEIMQLWDIVGGGQAQDDVS